MKTAAEYLTVKSIAIAIAIRAALMLFVAAPLLAQAQALDAGNEDVRTLIYPLSWLEIGVINVPTDSPKFGEYNGLDRSGAYLLANVELRGGDAYQQGDGSTRWQVRGIDLGTTSRRLEANVAQQGLWNFGVHFDQLRHYTTDGSYQTPFLGSPGDNLFILPPAFGVINTTTTTSAGVITSENRGAQSLSASQLAMFHNKNIYTERRDTGLTAGYHMNAQWALQFDFKRLDQSGAKLIGSGTDAYDLSDAGGFKYGGERIAILMNPTEYKTDTLNLTLNWTGRKGFASAGYFGSIFHDDYSGISWSNPFVTGGTGGAPNPAPGTSPGAAFPLSTMSTPPGNQLHQLNLSGGYLFSPATKLTGGLSYARNTQNASYDGTYTLVPNTAEILPVNSLDGLVVMTHADLKLTHQASSALNFVAGFKYNERDNRTASHEYTFLDLGGEELSAVNIPMSNKRTQFDLGADYRFSAHQKLHLGYESERINRWCNNPLANNAQGELSATNAGYYTTASCVQVPRNSENRLVATWRASLGESVNVNAGFTHGRRSSEVNRSFYNPMQANNQGFENYGYLAFFDASRRQNLFKAGVTWQATDRFTIGLNGRRTNDDYDSTLGVQKGDTSSANLDASFSYSENGSVAAYASWQRRTRDLLSASGRDAIVLRDTLWSNNFSDRDNTVGFSGKQKSLLGGKLDLTEEFNYSSGTSRYVTNLVQNISAAVGNSGSSPDIRAKTTQFRFVGAYRLNTASSVLAGYLYQRLKSSDYFYSAYQFGFTPTTLLPTNQQAPNYTVNTIFVAYRYSFR